MNNTDRALRLQMDARQAINDNIISFINQKRKADKIEDKRTIQDTIDDLRNEYEVLLDISIDIVENSKEVKQTIIELRSLTNQLDEEAEKISNVTKALEKGTKIVNKVTKIVKGVKKLILPVPV